MARNIGRDRERVGVSFTKVERSEFSGPTPVAREIYSSGQGGVAMWVITVFLNFRRQVRWRPVRVEDNSYLLKNSMIQSEEKSYFHFFNYILEENSVRVDMQINNNYWLFSKAVLIISIFNFSCKIHNSVLLIFRRPRYFLEKKRREK